MKTPVERLEAWMAEPEAERLEFKEAKSNYSYDKLARYCVALANEGGGRIVLGVTDKRPRRVVGSQAFPDPGHTAARLTRDLQFRIEFEEIQHPDGRALAFTAPPHMLGLPVQYQGIYWARAGDELKAMPPEQLRRIFDEAAPDFSAELHPQAVLSDLDPALIEQFRGMWRRKSGNAALDALTQQQLLEDAELMQSGKLTLAALILLGTKAAMGRHLAQAEVVFEYPTPPTPDPAVREFRVSLPLGRQRVRVGAVREVLWKLRECLPLRTSAGVPQCPNVPTRLPSSAYDGFESADRNPARNSENLRLTPTLFRWQKRL